MFGLVFFYFTYNSSALVRSAFGAIWEDPEGGFIKFAVKRASKQDETLHMEGKLHVILYFRAVCAAAKTTGQAFLQHQSKYQLRTHVTFEVH